MTDNYSKIYNQWWEKYLTTNTEEPGTKYRKNKIKKYIKKFGGVNSSILDCGCGAGELIAFLIKNGIEPKNIDGCDVSNLVIKRNKSMFNKVNFFVSDLSKRIKTPKKQYDIVICSEVIEHIRDWKNLVYNLKKFLKKDGIIVLSTQSGKRYGHHIELGHLKHFNTKEISRELQKNGITTISSNNCGWPFMNLKNVLVNLPVLNARENIMRSAKQSLFSKIQFKIFDVAYMLSSRSKGPQIFVVGKKSKQTI